MIGIRKSVAEKFHTIQHTEACEGRIHSIVCTGDAGSLQVVNVHLVPGLARGVWREWVGRLQACLLRDERSVSVVIGDFNFFPAEEGRFDVASGTVIEGDGWHEDAFHDICSGLVETEQLGPIRRQVTAEGEVTSLSRLNRAFVRGHAVDTMDMRPRAVAVGCPTTADPASDHLPLVVTLHAPGTKPVRSDCISKWLVRHPRFDEHLAQCLDRGPADPNLGLQLFKDAVRAAAELTRQEVARGSAVSVHEKLYWATLLFRASRSGDARRARGATVAWPDLLRRCGGDGEVVDREGLSSCISNLQCDALDEEATELDECDADDDQSKSTRLLVNHERRKLWGLRRKRFATCGIVGASGQPLSSTAEEAEELRRFRQGSFESNDTDEGLWQKFTPYIQRVPTGIEWPVSLEDFLAHASARKDTAPGPDGITDGAYATVQIRQGRKLCTQFSKLLPGERSLLQTSMSLSWSFCRRALNQPTKMRS